MFRSDGSKQRQSLESPRKNQRHMESRMGGWMEWFPFNAGTSLWLKPSHRVKRNKSQHMKQKSCSQAWVRVVLSIVACEINSFPAAWCKPKVISVASLPASNLLLCVELLLIGWCWCVEQNQTNSQSSSDKTRRGLMWWLHCSEHLWISAVACQSYLTVAMYWTGKFL